MVMRASGLWPGLNEDARLSLAIPQAEGRGPAKEETGRPLGVKDYASSLLICAMIRLGIERREGVRIDHVDLLIGERHLHDIKLEGNLGVRSSKSASLQASSEPETDAALTSISRTEVVAQSPAPSGQNLRRTYRQRKAV